MRNRLNQLLLLLCLSIAAITCFAQIPGVDSGSNNQQETDSVTVEKTRLKELIETLESDTARQEFIDNLKTLSDQLDENKEQAEAEPLVPVASWLNLDENRESLVGLAYTKLTDMGFSDSAIGNLILCIASIIGIIVIALVNHKAARWFNRRLKGWRQKMHLPRDRFTSYFRLQIWFGYIFAVLTIIHLISAIYDPWPAFIRDSINIVTVINYVIILLLILLAFTTVWEVVNATMEVLVRRTRRMSRARIDTLLPIIRNVLLITLLVLMTLVVLSEFGINIVPLMAGAGVLGIAVGFGAQTMVKDFIGGFIIIFEDLMQVGDVVRVAGHMGTVEKITVRKIQLRDLSGIVYTVPFGEITTVENYTKDYSYALFDVGVAYRENVDDVMECLTDIDKQIREDDNFKNLILEPIEILGVDKFGESAVVIKARIKTHAPDRWRVGREYNRLMKHEFDKRNISIPFPHQTLYFGKDKNGESPAAEVHVLDGRVRGNKKDEGNDQERDEQNEKPGQEQIEQKEKQDDSDNEST